MLIDAHVHAGSGDGLSGPWDVTADLATYERRANAAAIGRSVLFSVFHRDSERANFEVAEIVRSKPDRYLGFAFVHAERDRGAVADLVGKAVEDYRFVGIKVHRHEASITREVCDVARAYRLTVLYDVMGEVSVCELLAQEYPDVNFIIPHLGSFSDDWRAQMALIDHLCRHPNIHADSSGVRRFDWLVQAVKRAGAHKLLFGSDGPWLHPGLELMKIRALGLPVEDEALVLGGNLIRLLGPQRAAEHGLIATPDPRRPVQKRDDHWPGASARPGPLRPMSLPHAADSRQQSPLQSARRGPRQPG